ncbi:MAG: hypothetical protein HY245_11875 [Rhizobiales bacterium]|nr:hypothetical protein [Hyphomicrobiales bacterium]MBI3674086.1 hypothetical protein [Hyphomicrobiales bacterium]
MSIFAAAIDALFADPHLAEAALWRAGGLGSGVHVQVIRKMPDEIVSFGSSRAILPTVIIAMRGSEVAAPASGDTVQVGATVFDIIAQPRRDSLGLVWECEASARD